MYLTYFLSSSVCQALPNYDISNANWGTAASKIEYLSNCEKGYVFPLTPILRCPSVRGLLHSAKMQPIKTFMQ